jgi:FKBP-type peptidyl-prolyl cis-trans isomerase FklB
MKLPILVMMGFGAAMTLVEAQEPPVLKTPKDKMSYSIGMSVGRNITNQSIDINPDILAAGLKAIVVGAKPLLTDEEFQESMKALNTEVQAKMQAKRAEMQARQTEQVKEAAEKNKKDGEAFLAENKKKAGVITTPSGLQYKIVTAGTGKTPVLTDTVVTQYRGTFIDGKEFDSSYKRGEAFVTQVSNVIKGWSEALTMMPVGSKWQLFIPAELAYGAGKPPIPANSALLFDMELLSIQDKAKDDKPK